MEGHLAVACPSRAAITACSKQGGLGKAGKGSLGFGLWMLGVAGGSGSSSSSVRSSSEKKTGREEADGSDGRRWATVGIWALKWSESGGMGWLLVLRLSRSQGLWRGAALASAPMRRILGVRAHAWQETIAGMARQRGNRLIMGGDCQGDW